MTPQTQFTISFLCVVAGHFVLYRWGDRLHRFAGAMLLTAAWAFSSGAGIQQFGHVRELMHSRLNAAEPGVRMADKISIEPHKWSVPTDTGVLSFHGSMFKEPGYNAVRSPESSY